MGKKFPHTNSARLNFWESGRSPVRLEHWQPANNDRIEQLARFKAQTVNAARRSKVKLAKVSIQRKGEPDV